MELRYVWDEEKNKKNREKHGIDFEDAALVFSDPNYIEMYDLDHSIDEERYIAIGFVEDVLFVVFTERKEYIRLISARVASEKEKEIYYGQNLYS